MINKIAQACLFVWSLEILSGHCMEPEATCQAMGAFDIGSYVERLESQSKPAIKLAPRTKAAIVKNANLLLQHSDNETSTETIMKALLEISECWDIMETCVSLNRLVEIALPERENEFYMAAIKYHRSKMISRVLEFKSSAANIASNLTRVIRKIKDLGMGELDQGTVLNSLLEKKNPGMICQLSTEIVENFNYFFVKGMTGDELQSVLCLFTSLEEKSQIIAVLVSLKIAYFQRQAAERNLAQQRGNL